MSKSKNDHRRCSAVPDNVVKARAELRRSGASGIHADQNARRHRAGKTNRVGNRSARRNAAIAADLA